MSPAEAIFLSIAEAKSLWKVILTHYVKNWMQKDKDKIGIFATFGAWNDGTLPIPQGLTHSINQSFREAESALESSKFYWHVILHIQL